MEFMTENIQATEEPQERSEFQKTVVDSLADLRAFIERTVSDNDGEDDYWVAFSDHVDVHFCVNDDPDDPDFGEMEFFAYPIIYKDGIAETGTDFICISLTEEPLLTSKDELLKTFRPDLYRLKTAATKQTEQFDCFPKGQQRRLERTE